jgi:hypothetical protein
MLDVIFGAAAALQLEYNATSQARPSETLIVNNGHSAVAVVVKENQVTGVLPLFVQTTLTSVVEEEV